MHLPNLLDAKKRNKTDVSTYYDTCYIPDDLQEYTFKMKYYIETYGCQMNTHDSENIKGILEELKMTETTDIHMANIVIFNTCAIRENAHNKVFGNLGHIKDEKKKKDNLIICFCGCMAQEESVINVIKEKYKWIDIVFGTHNICDFPVLLNNYFKNKERQIEVYSEEGNVYENIPVKRDSKYKAWVNVMYGCDKFCTYCIVPYTRGSQRSRKLDDIINEVEELVNLGYKEVTLLGQNVNAYGLDLDDHTNLAVLLEHVARTNIDRVRFITSHPWDFTDEMIDVIKSYDNIMPYIHLPVQSGSNRILKLMGRLYTKNEYIELYQKIKDKIPNVSITTDIIVGFPGETEEDFKETIDLYQKLKFDLAYTFIFSKRVGTPAEKLIDETSLEEKKKRLQILNELVNKCAKEKNDKYLNKIVEVLIESTSDKEGYLTGYTDTMKLVNVKAPIDIIGNIVNVKITSCKTWSLDGELVDDTKKD